MDIPIPPIIVVRHAHPADSHFPRELSCHWIDSDLSETGVRQALCTAQRLKAELAGERCRIWSSDLRRASQTAEVIGRALGAPVHTTPDLREYKSCLPDEVTAEQMYRYVPASSAPARDILANRQAETWREFYDRVSGRMELLIGEKDGVLIVVGHYGTNMQIISWWLGIGLTPDGDAKVSFETSLASITVLKVKANSKRCIERLNDVCHLHAAGLTEAGRLLVSPKPSSAPEAPQKKFG